MQGICDTCGNEYHDVMEISEGGRTYTFDSFGCAIQKLAPTCLACGVRVMGHGTEQGGDVYCCNHCAGRA
ncbi:MAG: hypothetical protein BRD48_00890 [Bacteroidetes bacterium QS_9_68_14]|nr:MAG: hypothetical protein BRD48_00890 [Bacteroidetes bacterium QS_9_68_14]